ncbi:hypothetical protein U1Q18_005406, partial [Sarracenia purpurea var. burkii]
LELSMHLGLHPPYLSQKAVSLLFTAMEVRMSLGISIGIILDFKSSQQITCTSQNAPKMAFSNKANSTATETLNSTLPPES